jgi:hypothetical protein
MSNLEDYGLSPEEIASFEEEQKKQERLYNEYKESGGWQKKLPNGLNPTIFSEELISSIPEDEYKELCAAYKKIEKQVWSWRNWKLWVALAIVVLSPIAYIVYLIYLFFT